MTIAITSMILLGSMFSISFSFTKEYLQGSASGGHEKCYVKHAGLCLALGLSPFKFVITRKTRVALEEGTFGINRLLSTPTLQLSLALHFS